MARSGKPTGTLAFRLAFGTALAGLIGGLIMTVFLVRLMEHKVQGDGWLSGLGLCLVIALITGAAGLILAAKLGSRATALGLAVSKLGRGSEVKIRVEGNDELTALGRGLQYLADDLTELLRNQDTSSGGGLAFASMDPLVKQLRDKTVPQQLPTVPGFEVDGVLSPGSRGGLDYFDLVATTGENAQSVAYVVSAEGQGPLSVYACRLARDELHRALLAGATPRKALAHTNKVCKTALPAGCCAKATLLQIADDGCKLYQAGARMPLLICQRGEVLELNAEGIAIGLDDGPVFEKSLRPQEIVMTPGTRLVLGNDPLHRCEGLLDLLRQHSPRHTNMFMNVVLNSIEQDAGSEGLREDVVLMTVKKAGQE